jgi:YesN/AraC family two-component response regulator
MECNLHYLNSINRVIDYIEEHLQYDLSLSELAKVFIEFSPAETAWVPVTAPKKGL